MAATRGFRTRWYESRRFKTCCWQAPIAVQAKNLFSITSDEGVAQVRGHEIERFGPPADSKSSGHAAQEMMPNMWCSYHAAGQPKRPAPPVRSPPIAAKADSTRRDRPNPSGRCQKRAGGLRHDGGKTADREPRLFLSVQEVGDQHLVQDAVRRAP